MCIKIVIQCCALRVCLLNSSFEYLRNNIGATCAGFVWVCVHIYIVHTCSGSHAMEDYRWSVSKFWTSGIGTTHPWFHLQVGPFEKCFQINVSLLLIGVWFSVSQGGMTAEHSYKSAEQVYKPRFPSLGRPGHDLHHNPMLRMIHIPNINHEPWIFPESRGPVESICTHGSISSHWSHGYSWNWDSMTTHGLGLPSYKLQESPCSSSVSKYVHEHKNHQTGGVRF